MKKIFIFLLGVMLIMSSCNIDKNLNDSSNNNNESSNDSNNTTNSDDTNDSTNDSNDNSNSDNTNDSTNDSNDNSNSDNTNDSSNDSNNTTNMDNKYSLGYGDYVYYKDTTKDISNIHKDIEDLSKVITNEINDIYISNYQKGLLDLFDINNEIKMIINISDDELEMLNLYHEQNNKESYRVCSLDIELNGIVYHYENVGIRQKGNTSRGEILSDDNKINLRHYKLSFTEEFDDEYRSDEFIWDSNEHLEYQKDRSFYGMEKLNIRWNRNADATYLKEYYSYEMYRANNVLSPRSNLLNVLMNVDGKVNNLGVYLAVEDIGKEFIKRNLKKEYQKGDLYKLGWSYKGARLDNLSNDLFGVEEQVKDGKGYYQVAYPYDLKTNKKTSQHEQIKAFINNIIYTPVDEYYDFLIEHTYYNSVINYLAISYLLGDPDDLRGNYNNTYLYFISETNQAIFIPTDHDRALGSTGGGGNPTNHHGAYSLPFDNHTGYSMNDSIFFQNTIFETGNEKIKEDYINSIENIINDNWMSSVKFKTYFDIAKNNYKNELVLGNMVNGDEILFNIIEANDPADSWNMTIFEYFRLKVDTFNTFKNGKDVYSEYYFRSDINNWDASNNYNLKLINDIPTIELYLESNNNYCFKIATNNWSKEFNYSNLIDDELFKSIGVHKNIMVKESGLYKIEIITINNEEILKITKIS